MPEDWDLKVIDYWDGILKSYNNCHEEPEAFDTADKVTQAIMSQFPTSELEVKETAPKRQKLDDAIRVELARQEVLDATVEPETRREIEEEYGEEYKGEEEDYREVEEEMREEAEENRGQPLPDYTQYNTETDTKPENTFAYPPPPQTAGQDDGLSNVIMAWYYAGYYTALYQISKHSMKPESKETPILCKAGCGFYGNAAFEDMCSKCFKEKSPEEAKQRKRVRSPTPEPKEMPSSDHVDHEKKEDTVPLQNNKGKCYNCRKKVPLAKQAANKCRCGFVFCDTHKYPDRHSCEIDFVKMDREILAKNNPKLHERPKGGRSFQRIDSL